MRTFIFFLCMLGAASPARAQAISAEVPDQLSIQFERPDVPGRFLQLNLELSTVGAALVGCETASAGAGCHRTRRISITTSQLASLRRSWRMLASGVRCRARRPAGNWVPTRVTFEGASLDGLAYEHGERGLSPRCFPIERVAGWFLDRWRAAP